MALTLLTGATGTLGRTLAPRLAAAGHTVRGTSREPPHDDGPVDEWVELTLPDGPGFETALDGIDVVVHAASSLGRIGRRGASGGRSSGSRCRERPRGPSAMAG